MQLTVHCNLGVGTSLCQVISVLCKNVSAIVDLFDIIVIHDCCSHTGVAKTAIVTEKEKISIVVCI